MAVKLEKMGDLDKPDKEGVADTKRLLGTVLVRFWSTWHKLVICEERALVEAIRWPVGKSEGHLLDS